jgi:hypothetical protein
MNDQDQTPYLVPNKNMPIRGRPISKEARNYFVLTSNEAFCEMLLSTPIATMNDQKSVGYSLKMHPLVNLILIDKALNDREDGGFLALKAIKRYAPEHVMVYLVSDCALPTEVNRVTALGAAGVVLKTPQALNLLIEQCLNRPVVQGGGVALPKFVPIVVGVMREFLCSQAEVEVMKIYEQLLQTGQGRPVAVKDLVKETISLLRHADERKTFWGLLEPRLKGVR